MSVAERSRFVVDAVLTGKKVPFTRAGSVSAIAKTPVPGPQRVTRLGIADDEQGDLRVHGGPDKAIHHYPRDHYRAWNADIGLHPLLEQPGAFGENITTTGMLEHTVCLGDRYRMGTALVEVSQSRQPCWKLSDRFAIPDMARRVQDTGRTGWYYRVIKEGYVQQGDTLVLADRPHAAWPLSRLINLLYQRAIDPGVLHDVLALPLVPSWHLLFQRAAIGVVVGPGRGGQYLQHTDHLVAEAQRRHQHRAQAHRAAGFAIDAGIVLTVVAAQHARLADAAPRQAAFDRQRETDLALRDAAGRPVADQVAVAVE